MMCDTATGYSRPAVTTESMPQSGFVTIRAKLRSVTSPQAAMAAIAGFGTMASQG